MPWTQRLRESLAVWGDVRLLLIGVVMLGMSFAEGGANDWLALAVVDGHGFDPTVGAAIFTVFTVAMTTARVLGGPVLDRFGRVPILQILAATGVVGLTLFIFSTETWMLILGTVLWGVGCSLGFPVGMSAAADVTDRRLAASRVSAVAIIGYCAFLAGPPFLGFLGEHFGILNALLVILGLMVVAGIAAPAAREQTGPRARVTARRVATRQDRKAAVRAPSSRQRRARRRRIGETRDACRAPVRPSSARPASSARRTLDRCVSSSPAAPSTTRGGSRPTCPSRRDC